MASNRDNPDFRLAPRRFSLPPIGARVAALTREVFSKRGFSEAHILSHWPAIMGETLAGFSAPDRLSFPRQTDKTARGPRGGATLTIRVDGPVAVEIRHLEPQIIERINNYYGYQAVARLKLVQGPLPARARPKRRVIRPLRGEERTALAQSLEPIEEPALRAALERLGERVIGHRS
jgi:hypothetical protein